MGDLDLLRKFQEIDKNTDKSKIGLLENLKSRIETEIFFAEFSDEKTDAAKAVMNRLNADLNFMKTCIPAYEKRILNAESMKLINKLNKRYKR